MLYYCEFKDAIDRGFINHDTIMTSRINGQLHDYILEGEPIDLVKHFYTLMLQKCLTRSVTSPWIMYVFYQTIHRCYNLIISGQGMSNSNPLLAKLALDNEAKKTPTMRANWSYEDVETKVWAICTHSRCFFVLNRLLQKTFRLIITRIA